MGIVTKVWAVYQGGDDRRVGYPAEFYSSEVAAKVAAKGRGWYGGDAPVHPHPAIYADGAAYLLACDHPIDVDLKRAQETERVKKEALAKLSPAEKAALGL